MSILNFCILAVSSYLLGSFNAAIVVSKVFCGFDIREKGSGNGGLTNSYRVMGGKLTALVLIGDVVKTILAIALGGFLAGTLGKLVAGIFVVIGHVFPLYFRFRGGKGVLAAATMLCLFDWRVALVVIGCFLLGAGLTRYVSLGSILGSIGAPIATWYFYRGPVYVLLVACLGGWIIWMHRANIKRLKAGTENKFYFSRKKGRGER